MAVYFLYAKKVKMIKIGYSKNPKKRLSSLQTASPLDLITLAVLPGDRDVEQAVHRKFAHLRDRGEWFLGKEDLFEWIHFVRKIKRIPIFRVPEAMEKLEYEEYERRIRPYKMDGYVIIYPPRKEVEG